MRYRACHLRKRFVAMTTGTWPGATMDARGLSPETTGSEGTAAKYSILAAWDSDVIPQTSFRWYKSQLEKKKKEKPLSLSIKA